MKTIQLRVIKYQGDTYFRAQDVIDWLDMNQNKALNDTAKALASLKTHLIDIRREYES